MNPNTQNSLHPLDHLALIRVSGDDAAHFLQGQLTCDVRTLTDAAASIAAFCNPKGRVISTLLLLKNGSEFWLVLPRSLLDKVIQKLRMYVLRSKVQLCDGRESHQILGLNYPQAHPSLTWHAKAFRITHESGVMVALPSTHPRFLYLSERDAPSSLMATLDAAHFVQSSAEIWRYQDIGDGFPWFEIDRTEQFIPQMLNIDGLGGISFNKGCYTGQEIVARTHYLGKAKRQLFVAECQGEIARRETMTVLSLDTREKRGDVLAWQNLNGCCRLLLVLQMMDDESKGFILDDEPNTELTLLPGQ